jgi:hypothetical protein
MINFRMTRTQVWRVQQNNSQIILFEIQHIRPSGEHANRISFFMLTFELAIYFFAEFKRSFY